VATLRREGLIEKMRAQCAQIERLQYGENSQKQQFETGKVRQSFVKNLHALRAPVVKFLLRLQFEVLTHSWHAPKQSTTLSLAFGK